MAAASAARAGRARGRQGSARRRGAVALAARSDAFSADALRLFSACESAAAALRARRALMASPRVRRSPRRARRLRRRLHDGVVSRS